MPSDNFAKAKSTIHAANINKRGSVKPTLMKKEAKIDVKPAVMGLMLFVVAGSAIFSVLATSMGIKA